MASRTSNQEVFAVFLRFAKALGRPVVDREDFARFKREWHSDSLPTFVDYMAHIRSDSPERPLRLDHAPVYGGWKIGELYSSSAEGDPFGPRRDKAEAFVAKLRFATDALNSRR